MNLFPHVLAETIHSLIGFSFNGEGHLLNTHANAFFAGELHTRHNMMDEDEFSNWAYINPLPHTRRSEMNGSQPIFPF